ncbi:hypothetical protein GCK72_006865 [Caenorhabditis remanei]|uniref:NTF2-like domain-containing protein n=1 Tax=Caenorhabditis remanei TaxID=31234 RepID=A0A6A5HJX9_CAERE|nr:hypothetical protein GCK72_006865 [Caenorhabditis remanei]KAF1766907.1 hypothetical protein GCK72_006865 [Caenorhabditis remanei]
MFIRLVFLLLLANSVFIETSKIHEILKKLGKRYETELKPVANLWDAYSRTEKENARYEEYDSWKELSTEEVGKIKNQTSYAVRNNFIEVSSTENLRFNDALLYIESILDEDFTAEVCGDGKKMNSYQYIKHLTHSASQHKGYFWKEVVAGFDESQDRDVLKFNMNLHLMDKMGFLNKRFFHLKNVIQTGTCANKGVVGDFETTPEGLNPYLVDMEDLKVKPTTKLFLKLFTPAVYQYLEENPNKLPRYWLSGINSTLTKINVCHEKVTEPVEYTEDQFRSWYAQFGLMWHPKEGFENQTYSLQLIELLDDSITARVTMKLQMGRDKEAELHDWNFKFLAKKNEHTWYINKIEVLCDPTIEYKDESLKLIREVVAGKFVDELKYKNDTQWYSTVDFIKQFTKPGHLVMEDCVNDIVGLITQIDLFKKDRDDVHGIKFTKYQIDEEIAIDLPAADTATFRFKTVSQAADSTETEKVEIEREWSFDIKWDQMDQFYYIEKMGIGCGKPWTVKGVFKSIVDTIGK